MILWADLCGKRASFAVDAVSTIKPSWVRHRFSGSQTFRIINNHEHQTADPIQRACWHDRLDELLLNIVLVCFSRKRLLTGGQW